MAHAQRFVGNLYLRALAVLIVFLTAVTCLTAVAVPSAQAVSTEKTAQNFGNVVVFVQFSDNDGTFLQNSADVQKMVSHYDNNSSSPRSLAGYLKAVSYDQFLVNSYLPQYNEAAQTITPITLDNTYAYYAENSSYTFISAVNSKIDSQSYGDFSVYDADNNGYIDNVTYVIDGGVDDSDRLSVFHSHKENYSGSGAGFNGMVNQVNIIAGDVAFGAITGFGTINHEFMHSVGFPDLYTETGDVVPVGRWDLMATVANYMQYPLAYMRSTEYSKLSDTPGWLTIDTISSNTQGVELVPASSSSGDQAFILKSALSSSEVFVVEYRQKAPNVLDPSQPGVNALDTKIPGTGLVVYRVNTLVPLLNNRTSPNNFGVYVFRNDPGDDPAIDGLGASFFSQESGRTEIGSTDLAVTDGVLTFSDGSNSGIYIHDIGAAGETISFDVDFADTKDVGLWSSVAGTDVAAVDSFSIASAASESTIYAAYDDGAQLKISSSTDNGAWTAVGGALPNYYQGAQLCVSGGVLYASYIESNTYKNVLYAYKGSSWVKLATLGANDSYSNTALAASSSGVYFAYCDNQVGFANNTHVVAVSPQGVVSELYKEDSGSKYASQLHLCESADGAYLSYRTGDVPVIVKLGSTSTQLLAPACSGSLQDVSIAESDGKLFASTSNKNGVRVWEYADGAWTQLGDALSNSSAYSLALSASHGEPFVLLSRQGESESSSTVVMRYADGAWEQEGLTVDSSRVGASQLSWLGDKLYAAVTSPRNEYSSYPVVKVKDIVFDTEEPEPPSIADAEVSIAGAGSYTGMPKTPTVSVTLNGKTLVEGMDYELTWQDNVNAGQASVLVTAISGGSYVGAKTQSFTIAQAVITNTAIDSVPNQTYTGSAIMPKPSVTVETRVLDEDMDFTYSWSQNINAGTAYVNVVGKNNYKGSASTSFIIEAAPTPPTPPTPPATNTVTVYRLYNEALHSEHLFTTSVEETRVLVANHGWIYEGCGWYAPDQGTPVYRLYNPGLGSHLYTTSQGEINELTANWGWVMDFNGEPALYSGGSNAIYRLYNPQLFGQHLLTTSQGEYNALTGYDWLQEGHVMDCVQLGDQTLPLP